MPENQNENQDPTQNIPIVKKEMSPPLNKKEGTPAVGGQEKSIKTPTPFDSPQRKKEISLQGFDYLSADQGKVVPFDKGYMDLSFKEQAKERATAFALGAVKTSRGILQTIESLGEGAEWLVNALPGIENVDLDWNFESESFQGKSSEEVTQALGEVIGVDFEIQTEAGRAASTLTNWGLGMLVGSAALKGVGTAVKGTGMTLPPGATKVAERVAAMPVTKLAGLQAKEALVETTFMEVGEDNLSNLVQNTPLANPVTEYLAASPDDSVARGKFKNAVEGFLTGGLVEVGMKGVAKGAKILGLSEVFVRGVDNLKELRKAEGEDAISILAREAGEAEELSPLAKDAWYTKDILGRENTIGIVDLSLADEREFGKAIQNVKETNTRIVRGRGVEENKVALQEAFADVVEATKKPGKALDPEQRLNMGYLKENFPKEYAIANRLLGRAVKEERGKGFQEIAGNFITSAQTLRDVQGQLETSIATTSLQAMRSMSPSKLTSANQRIDDILEKMGPQNPSQSMAQIISVSRDELIKSPTLLAEMLDHFTNADRLFDIILNNRGAITELEEPLESLVRKPRRATTQATRSPKLSREAEENAVRKLRARLPSSEGMSTAEVTEKVFLGIRNRLYSEDLTGVDFITSLSAFSKPGIVDLVTEYRYANMLSSPRGRILDALSSSAQVVVDKFSEMIGAIAPRKLLFGEGLDKGSELYKRTEETYKRVKGYDAEIERLAVEIMGHEETLESLEETLAEELAKASAKTDELVIAESLAKADDLAITADDLSKTAYDLGKTKEIKQYYDNLGREARQKLRDARKELGVQKYSRDRAAKLLDSQFSELAPKIHNQVAREVGYKTMLVDRFKEVMSYYNPFGNMSKEDKQRAILSSIESFRSGSSITLADRGIEASAQVGGATTSASNLIKRKKSAATKLKEEDALALVGNKFGIAVSEMTTELVDAILELNKTGLGVTAMIDNWNKTAVTNSHIRSSLRAVGRKLGLDGASLNDFVERKFKEAYDGLVFKEQRALKDAEGRAVRYFDEQGGSTVTDVVDKSEAQITAELDVFLSQEYALIPKTADEVTNTKRFDPNDGLLAWTGSKIDSLRKGRAGKVAAHIIPFLRTPINLAISADRMTLDPVIGFAGKVAEKGVRAFRKDYSIPDSLLGYKNQFISDMNSGNPALRARAMGRFATGSALVTASWLLSESYDKYGYGLVGPGPGSSDWKRHEAWLEAGNLPYSIKFPNGTSVEFRRLGPLGIVLGSLVSANQVNQFSAEDADDGTARGLLAAMEYMANESNITVIKELTSWASGDEQTGLETLEKLILSIASQYAPGGSITRDFRKYQAEGESVSVKHDWDFVDNTYEKIKQFYGITESAGRLRRNFFGETIKKSGWGEAEVGNPKINPLMMVSSKKGDPVMNELVLMDYSFPSLPTKMELRDSSGNMVEVDLTSYYNDKGQEAYDRFRELMGTLTIRGKTFKEHLKERMEADKWQGSTNKYKSAVVNEFRTAFKALATRQIKEEYGEQMGLVSPELDTFLK